MGTTLVEELEDAATFAEMLADRLLAEGKPYGAGSVRAKGRRYLARAERVRELETDANGDGMRDIIGHWIRALTGPLPATPPETPGDPQEKGQP